MRTKALILSAAVVAAGVASSMAQSNVYSLNIVGYVNVPVPAGFSIVSNPLDDGLGDSNVISSVLSSTNTPDNTVVYVFSPTTGYTLEQYTAGFGWFPATSDLPPGVGFFIDSPTNTTVTFVGQIAAGTYTNALARNSFNLVGSIIPESLPLGNPGITNTLQLNAGDNDVVYRFDNATGYDLIQYTAGFGWFDSGNPSGSTNGPALRVGEGFFIQTQPNTGGNWVQTFSVN
jgi:hypothetical protein